MNDLDLLEADYVGTDPQEKTDRWVPWVILGLFGLMGLMGGAAIVVGSQYAPGAWKRAW